MKKTKPNKILIKKNRERYSTMFEKKMFSFYNRVGGNKYKEWKKNCIDKISVIYPSPLERSKVRLYHVLISGSIDYDASLNFDFPGDCSIQKMIEELPE